MAIEYGSLPFPEAIDYLRGKVNLPTASWTDLWEGQHTRAFTVAGATKEALLTDLREAMTAALEDGETLEQFRTRFDAIVERHGWPYKGGRNWRTRVIYETNMRTAHQAGRYEQLQAIKHRRPFWQYQHSDFVVHPRPEHEAWDGLVLDADDAWWQTHYPPNGWGCRCSVRALSRRDLARLGKRGPDEAPPLEWEDKTVGIRGPNPRTVRVPRGIDPGWGYNVGEAATGRRVTPEVYAQWATRKDRWRPLIASGYREAGRPERIPLVKPPVPLPAPVNTVDEAAQLLRATLGADTKTYAVAGLPVTVDAPRLAGHIDLPRTRYLPLLDDLLGDPYEVWLNWEQHQATGRVRLVTRFIKGYEISGGRFVVLVAEAAEQTLLSATFLVSHSRSYINRERQGVLLKGSGEE